MDIGVMQFKDNEEIKFFRVPDGTRAIRAKAFENCVNLREIWLPVSLKNIDMKAFHGCRSLDRIHYAGTETEWEKVEISPVGTECLRAENSALLEAKREREYNRSSGNEDVYEKISGLLVKPDGGLHIIPVKLWQPGVYGKTGDMTLILFPEGKSMLIDTGYCANWPAVRRFLDRVRLDHLDFMAFSHADPDHVTNARAIGEYLYRRGGSVGRFLWTGQKYGAVVDDFEAFLRERHVFMDCAVLAGRTFAVDGARILVLNPDAQEIRECANEGSVRNNQSMALKITYGKASFLTSGDLYESQEKKMVSVYGERLKASVMKVNHHGAYTSSCAAWLGAVQPEFAFTENNDNGDSGLSETLRKNAIRYASTGWQGTMLVSLYRDGSWKVQGEYPPGEHNLQRIAVRPDLLICGA